MVRTFSVNSAPGPSARRAESSILEHTVPAEHHLPRAEQAPTSNKDDDVSTNAVQGSEVKTPAHSQTLSRGIRALEILADTQSPMTIAELSEALGVHRSVAYRILRTLEDHSLLITDDAGRVQAGGFVDNDAGVRPGNRPVLQGAQGQRGSGGVRWFV